MKRILTFMLTMALFLSMTCTALAAPVSVDVNENNIPTLEIVKEEGTFYVTAKDAKGNTVFENTYVSGTVEDVIENTYKVIYANAARSCTHIPCNQTIVWGGVNHIISGDICEMVRTQFYKCACCGAIIGMVPNSTVIVGTHPAH